MGVKALRAYYYFELVKRYNRIPLITKVLTEEEANNQVPLITKLLLILS